MPGREGKEKEKWFRSYGARRRRDENEMYASDGSV